MLNRKSLVSGAAAAALVSALGLAYAQTSVDSAAPAAPEPVQSDVSSMPTYASSDSGTTASADTSAPSAAAVTESLDAESAAEPAPQADRN